MKGIFNIFLRHPSVPGPILWRMTDLTYAYYAFKGDLHHQLLAMHRKYGLSRQSQRLTAGPVVRIQPNHLSFSSSVAHNEIYGFKSKFGKGEFYTEILSEYGKSSIVSAMYRSPGRC